MIFDKIKDDIKENKRNQLEKLLNVDLFTDNKSDIVKLTGMSLDEVESCISKYQELQLLINSKKFNNESFEQEIEEQKEIVDYLMNEEKEEQLKMAS